MPALYREQQALAYEARAYHKLNPYPFFYFSDWRSEERGPLPRCLPFVKGMVRKSASWLFGRPPQILIPSQPELGKLISDAWIRSRMHSKMKAGAEQAGQDGGIFLKWSYDETRSTPLQFQVLNLIDHCQLYYDGDDLLMARIQYPYPDGTSGKWFWHREEWTDELYVTYQPQEVASRDRLKPFSPMPSPAANLWQVSSSVQNPFGIIPGHRIKNIETLSDIGAGDLWDCYRVIDRVNLTFHLMDKSNQLDSEPNKWFMDVAADQDNLERPLAPGENLVLESTDGKEGKVGVLESNGTLRPAMMEYAKELTSQLQLSTGIVSPLPSDVTNKGALTQGVMYQLYAPLIELTEDKRTTYGEDGICKFLERCVVGLSNLGVLYFSSVDVRDEDSYNVQLRWQPYFDQSNEDKSVQISNLVAMERAGYMPHDRAVEQVALMEGVGALEVLRGEASL